MVRARVWAVIAAALGVGLALPALALMPPLPEPGSRGAGALPPVAAAALERGLSAARREDWAGALREFKGAHDLAHCAPALMFNLGLAHARAGNLVPAALWYRAYLAAAPDATNADLLRGEILRFAEETEARAERAFVEAERLADQLSASAQSGAKSLRQRALEQIAESADMAGDARRSERLRAKARSLPGAAPLDNVIPAALQLFGAVLARDLETSKAIVAGHGADLSLGIKAGRMALVHARRGEPLEARAWLEPLDRETLDRLPQGENLAFQLRSLRTGEALGVLATTHRKLIGGAPQFGARYFAEVVIDASVAFESAEAEIARPLAAAARAYYERFDAGGKLAWDSGQYYVLALAILGDGNAIIDYMRKEIVDFALRSEGDLFARIAIAALRTMQPADVVRVIDRVADRFYVFTPPDQRQPELEFPAAYFARHLAEGRLQQALAVLNLPSPEQPQTKHKYERAFAYATATGKTDLAFELLPRIAAGDVALHHLYRLRSVSASAGEVGPRIAAVEAALCQGWRPKDRAQAHDVRWRLDLARWARADEYQPLPQDYDTVARDSPERLPKLLGLHGAVLKTGAMSARLER